MRKCVKLISIVLLLVVLLATVPALADVTIPSIFTSNMVVQQQKPIPVWGWAETGEEVTVKFIDQQATAKADDNGKWKLSLKPVKAGGPFEMVISGKNRIELVNVMVGEVWLCSGQSNMEWRLDRVINGAQEVSNADYPNIRFFGVPKTMAVKPADNVAADWKVCTPGTADSFSAVGYFFGRYLHKQLNVPIGLISASWGGTKIEPWMPIQAYQQAPFLKDQLDYINSSDSVYRESLAKALDSYEIFLSKAKQDFKAGLDVPRPPAWPVNPLAKDKQQPTTLFNGMINPIIPFAIRGAIWYQGESNCIQKDRMLYYEKFKLMLQTWRELWQQGDFPFYFVQLAPYAYDPYHLEPDELPLTWEAQTACLDIPNTGMAVTVDIGNIKDIHPKNKQDVGKRLALWALAKDYGKKNIVYSGPLYKSMKVEGSKIRISFDHTGTGLTTLDKKPLTWFEIAGKDKKFVKATAKIKGNTVIVSSKQVKEPVAVRFAWNQIAEPNLANKQGLPASPFRTDNW